MLSCGRQEENAEAELDPGSLEALERLGLPEPELDDLVLEMTVGYERLRLFLYDELPPQAYEELFNDIFKTADRKRILERSASGRWLNGLKIDQRGVGLMSMFGEEDSPATLSFQHSRLGPAFEIRKPFREDVITIGDKNYYRRSHSVLELYSSERGIMSLHFTFTLQATPELDPPGYPYHHYEYDLSGGFMLSALHNEKGYRVDGAGVRLFHYDVEKLAERSSNPDKVTSGEALLSRHVFNDELVLSEDAKMHLLKLMEMVMIYWANYWPKKPERNVYSELLQQQPYKLAKAPE